MSDKLHRRHIFRKFEFDAGHRLLNHEGKCRGLHGHRYVVYVHCTAPELDGIGRIIDFDVIKRKIGGWIESNWDHAMILNAEDPCANWFINEVFADSSNASFVKSPFYGMRYFLLDCNPTAENLASRLLSISQELMKEFNIKVTKVRVFETPNCGSDSEL
jgi:6-pyruvoyltetrahydropterin/6-carboxytetrahydropterin synthase